VTEKDRNLYLQDAPTAGELIAAADLDAAAAAVASVALRIPALASLGLGEIAGGPVALKPECLQRSGSFKLRGALAKLAALGPGVEEIVTASAGNHGRAVAYAARARGVPCTVFMPCEAPVSKVTAVEQLGARVELHGDSVDEALAAAHEVAEQGNAALVHPFDDLDVIAGQATLGRELVEEVPDLARVIVPVGGGGLAAGLGIALRRLGRDVELIGVQARACAPYASLLAGGEPGATELSPGATIADGIAIKRPGRLTLPLLEELLSGVETVGEDEIADAMVFLAERVKLVAEGAGAAAVAVLRAGRLAPVAGTTVAIVSGGNVDSGLLAGLLRRHDTEEGRVVRVFTRVPDRPGGLAELLSVVAGARANVVSVEHVREAVPLHVRETGLELTLETRGPSHTEEVLAALRRASYDVTLA
jgi:threonine dehydratase